MLDKNKLDENNLNIHYLNCVSVISTVQCRETFSYIVFRCKTGFKFENNNGKFKFFF